MDQMKIPYIAIQQGLHLLPAKMATDKARVILYAIGLQESRFKYRRQIKGPARGFWQFESGGGVKGVMQHRASKRHAFNVAMRLSVEWDRRVIYKALENNDPLAAAFARLLLWTDPKPLPEIGEQDEAWDYYIRNWRPGKPHPETWAKCYDQAVEALCYE